MWNAEFDLKDRPGAFQLDWLTQSRVLFAFLFIPQQIFRNPVSRSWLLTFPWLRDSNRNVDTSCENLAEFRTFNKNRKIYKAETQRKVCKRGTGIKGSRCGWMDTNQQCGTENRASYDSHFLALESILSLYIKFNDYFVWAGFSSIPKQFILERRNKRHHLSQMTHSKFF